MPQDALEIFELHFYTAKCQITCNFYEGSFLFEINDQIETTKDLTNIKKAFSNFITLLE